MAKRRVVVTGLGIVSPVGLNLKESWANIKAGNSGAATITEFDITGQSVTFACMVDGFDAEKYISRKDLKKMDTFIHYGIAAADEAIADAGIEVTEENAERIGVSVGSGIGGLPMIERNKEALDA
ncbi:MAG: beta-ketoacyl synthase N-terminal-like domain-containing protein, partial [Gammaproteobacteria bacterium]|nr:beta-ketoacyl synthase N-terminal-like domain-containing protein [Gammaproteobacteria bacterium]